MLLINHKIIQNLTYKKNGYIYHKHFDKKLRFDKTKTEPNKRENHSSSISDNKLDSTKLFPINQKHTNRNNPHLKPTPVDASNFAIEKNIYRKQKQ